MSAPRVALICMPWAPLSMPSPALGILQASLQEAGLSASSLHLNLLWHEMLCEAIAPHEGRQALDDMLDLVDSNRLLAGECFFGTAARGHAQRRQHLAAFLTREAPAAYASIRLLLGCRRLIPAFVERAMALLDLTATDIIGFSLTYQQQAASLMLAGEIKQRNPRVQVVIGGVGVRGSVGLAVLRNYGCIDAAFAGEAELALPEYVRRFRAGESLQGVPGLAWRTPEGQIAHTEPEAIADLDRLPLPRFEDYFRQREAMQHLMPEDLMMPIEGSRDCSHASRQACVFCGMNGPRNTYRCKRPARIAGECRDLVARHAVKRLLFTDHAMQPASLAPLGTARQGYEIYGSVRPGLSEGQASQLAAAGVVAVQVGVESLSSPLLKQMSKGVSAIRNVVGLIHLCNAGIQPSWSIIFGFPGEPMEEYTAMEQAVAALTHLPPPLSIHRVLLARFSTAYDQRVALGYANARPLPAYRFVHPDVAGDLTDMAGYFEFDYTDGRSPADYTAKLKNVVREWRQHYGSGTLTVRELPEGKTAIQDSRFNALSCGETLDPLGRCVYLHCLEPRTLEEVTAHVAAAFDRRAEPVTDITALLDRFVANRWMIRLDGAYLGTALTHDTARRTHAMGRHRGSLTARVSEADDASTIAALRDKYDWDLRPEEVAFAYHRLHMNNYVHVGLMALLDDRRPTNRRLRVKQESVPGRLLSPAQRLCDAAASLGRANPLRVRADIVLLTHVLAVHLDATTEADIDPVTGLLSAMAFIPLEADRNGGMHVWPYRIVRPLDAEKRHVFDMVTDGLDPTRFPRYQQPSQKPWLLDQPALRALALLAVDALTAIVTAIENGAAPDLIATKFRQLERTMRDHEQTNGLADGPGDARVLRRPDQRRYRNSIYLYGGNHFERMGRLDEAYAWYVADLDVEQESSEWPPHFGEYLMGFRTVERLLCAYRVCPDAERRRRLRDCARRGLVATFRSCAVRSAMLLHVLRTQPAPDPGSESLPLPDGRQMPFSGPDTREIYLLSLLYQSIIGAWDAPVPEYDRFLC